MTARITHIESESQLNEVFERSFERPEIILKHSASCGISFHIYEQLQRADVDINLVTVQTARPISNSIAERTGHRHQSPQLIVLRNGAAVYHATHYGISPERLLEHLQ